MPLTIIIGAQWGDEGKGHITDRLAQGAAVVARYSGGDNAGHTVTIGREIFKLHLIPSGIIHPGVLCLIGTARSSIRRCCCARWMRWRRAASTLARRG